jgi:hypothetical protein
MNVLLTMNPSNENNYLYQFYQLQLLKQGYKYLKEGLTEMNGRRKISINMYHLNHNLPVTTMKMKMNHRKKGHVYL